MSPKPADSEFRYLGLTDEQLVLLIGASDDIRQVVYNEALRLLMEENETGNDNLDI